MIVGLDVNSESCQISIVEGFAIIVIGFQPSSVFAKRSILDVWQGSEYTFSWMMVSVGNTIMVLQWLLLLIMV